MTIELKYADGTSRSSVALMPSDMRKAGLDTNLHWLAMRDKSMATKQACILESIE